MSVLFHYFSGFYHHHMRMTRSSSRDSSLVHLPSFTLADFLVGFFSLFRQKNQDPELREGELDVATLHASLALFLQSRKITANGAAMIDNGCAPIFIAPNCSSARCFLLRIQGCFCGS